MTGKDEVMRIWEIGHMLAVYPLSKRHHFVFVVLGECTSGLGVEPLALHAGGRVVVVGDLVVKP